MMEKCGCLPFYRLSLKDLEGPASRGFSLAWFLALTKSYAWLVGRINLTSYANDFVNAKSHMQERNLCSQCRRPAM